MKQNAYLGMRPGDLDGKPYAKYWNPDMGPLPEHVQRAILRGREAVELGLAPDQADQLMEPMEMNHLAGFLPDLYADYH